MTDCTHVIEEECVKRVNPSSCLKKEQMEKENSFIQKNENRERRKFKTFCMECDNCSKSYMCLNCGLIFCGRDDYGHAIDHSADESHSVVMDCITFELYCYICDDFVTLPFEPSLYTAIKSLKQLFDRDDLIEDNEENLANDDEKEAVDSMSDHMMNLQFSTNSKTPVEKGRKGKRNGKRSKVSPILDIPFQGNATIVNSNRNEINSRNDAIKPRGMKNIGNTCFMNSVLQALTSLQSFKDYFLSIPSMETLIEDEKTTQNGNNFYLTDSLKELMIGLSAKNSRDSLNPHEFRDVFIAFCPTFRGFRQHDSHEFMRYLLDQIHIEQKKCMKLPHMPDKMTSISYFFEGVLQSRVICMTCKNRSNKNDAFMDLSLDIPRGNITKLKLSQCLKTFFAREILEKGEKYECSKCKSKQDSSKQMFVKKLPEILCLHIKRFRETGGKVDSLIDFPLACLSMDDFLTEDSEETPCVYDLTSIIVHIGYGCGSGHYIAFGKRQNCWYQFDDQVVRAVAEETVSKQKAYVLLYTKRALKAAVV